MKIVLIGSGNLAAHLGPALKKSGHTLVQLVGRTETNTLKLATKLGCNYTIHPKEITDKADVFIIALRDEVISGYAKHLQSNGKLILHTSGSVNAKVLSGISEHYGVLYPLQTFSANRKITFSDIPLCIEASTAKAGKKLLLLARSLSKEVHWVKNEQRNILHLAAVFANNFSNHLFVIAEELLHKNKLDFALLRPLIAETAAKIQNYSPQDMQTGPARRGDTITIEKHIALLKNNKQYSRIYEVLTQSILDHDGPKL